VCYSKIKKYALTKTANFSRTYYYNTNFNEATLKRTTVALTSEVPMTEISVSLMVKVKKNKVVPLLHKCHAMKMSGEIEV
jgi:hypothetical protein